MKEKEHSLENPLTPEDLEELRKEVSTLDSQARIRFINDTGGTWSRFAVSNPGGDPVAIVKLKRDEYPTITDAFNTYKGFIGISADEALLAVNTVITNNVPFSGQNPWGYEGVDFPKAFGVERVEFFNDLKSHALAIPYLRKGDKERLIEGKVDNPKGVIVDVGPGTGLGVSFGVHNAQLGKHVFYGSEGGNQVIGAADSQMLDVVSKLLKVRPYARWEDAISGRGIKASYEALYGEKREVEPIMADCARGDEKAMVVFTHVCNFLGVFLHNIAKTFLPEGGIYVTGGIFGDHPENLEYLKKHSDFLKYYYSPELYTGMSSYVLDYSVDFVTRSNIGLFGLAHHEL